MGQSQLASDDHKMSPMYYPGFWELDLSKQSLNSVSNFFLLSLFNLFIQITNIDKKRNSNREALNALRKQESSKPGL